MGILQYVKATGLSWDSTNLQINEGSFIVIKTKGGEQTRIKAEENTEVLVLKKDIRKLDDNIIAILE